jgi:predicted Fe-Mo cluster-binding NifX family protein
MKIAITAKRKRLGDQIDPRFGRAPFILIVDTETMECEALDNRANVNAFKGAGIQAATMVADKGAEVLSSEFSKTSKRNSLDYLAAETPFCELPITPP